MKLYLVTIQWYFFIDELRTFDVYVAAPGISEAESCAMEYATTYKQAHVINIKEISNKILVTERRET